MTDSKGNRIEADYARAGAPSVLFDGVVLVVPEAAGTVEAQNFLLDAFRHCKYIGCVEGCDATLEAARAPEDEGVVSLSDDKSVTRFLQLCGNLRFWERYHA